MTYIDKPLIDSIQHPLYILPSPTMVITIQSIPTDLFENFLTPFFPDYTDSLFLPQRSPSVRPPTSQLLSNRRNKGKVVLESKRIVRSIDLEFLNSGTNDGLSSSIIREISILNSITPHPHIVPLTCVKYDKESNLFCMEFPNYDSSLRDILLGDNLRPMLSSDRVRDITHQICRGLAYIHAAGYIHRNLKPENILMSDFSNSRMTVRISDFSMARFCLPRHTQVLLPQTPEDVRMRAFTEKERIRMVYKAPELLLRLSEYDFGVDVWSAGVVVLELMLKTIPWFNATSESETLLRIFDFCNFEENSDLELSFALRTASVPTPRLNSSTSWSVAAQSMGPMGAKFVAKLLSINPKNRPKISSCLFDPFLLGYEMTEVAVFPPRVMVAPTSQSVPIRPMCAWVPFLIKASRLLQIPNNMVIHATLDMVSENPSCESILAALKLVSRYCVSRDMYKQVSICELCTAVKKMTTQDELIASETNMVLTNRFSVPFIDIISQIAPKQIYMLSHFVWDLCLLDETTSMASAWTQCVAAVIVARQWSGITELPLTLTDELSIGSVDDVQIIVSRCVLLVSERKSRIDALAGDDGVTQKLLEAVYRNHKGSIISTNFPQTWETSRSYIANVLQEARVETVATTPINRRLLRSSTLQHAAEWMGRRRLSMTTGRKRSRSATPVPPFSKRPSKRQHDENADPNVPSTPRRSARLLNKIS